MLRCSAAAGDVLYVQREATNERGQKSCTCDTDHVKTKVHTMTFITANNVY
jgi:hypothetical protein